MQTSQNSAMKNQFVGRTQEAVLLSTLFYLFFFSFKWNFSVTFLLAKKLPSCSHWCHGKSSALTACWTFPRDCLFSFQVRELYFTTALSGQ